MNRVMQVLLTANNTNLSAVLAASGAQVQAFSRSAVAGNDAVAASATRSGGAMKALAAGVTVGALAIGFAVSKAAEFEGSMRNVNSLLGLNEGQFRALSASVLDMSTALPQSANTLAEGLYDIASSGFAGADGMLVLEAAATAASAGLTTTETSAKGITAVLNAYGLTAADAANVSDVLFQTVNLGVVTFDELSSSIGDVVGTAAAAGVEIDEVGAAIATMTLSGISGAESATSLNRLLQAMIDPTDELQAAFEALGYESGASALETDGLAVVMDKLRVHTGGNIEALLKLFPEIRAARGALALMSNEGETYKRVSEEIMDADARQGATKRVLAEQMKGAAAQAQLFYNNIEVGAIKLGTLVLPMLLALMDGIRNVGELMGNIGSAVAPAWDSLVNVVENLWEILGNLYEAISPVVEGLLQVAGGIVIGGLTLIADALEAITGFLAENESAATALAIAVGGALVYAFRAAIGASTLFTTIGVALLSVQAGFVALTTGAITATSAMFGLEVLAKRLLVALAPLALIAVGAVAVTGLLNMNKASGDAKEAIDTLRQAIEDADSNSEAFELTRQGINDTKASIEDLNTELTDMTSTSGVGDFFADIFSYFADGPDAIGDTEEAIAAYRAELARLEVAAANVTSNTERMAEQFGMTEAQVLALADAAGIDLSQGFDKVKGPMGEAAQASKDVTAAEVELEAALAGLEGGLLDSAEAADALKTAFDGLTGGFVSVTEAQINFESAIRDSAAAALALIEQGLGPMDNALDEATGGLDTHTAAGAEVFGMLTDLRESGQDYITMLREQGRVEEAIAAEGALRQSLYDTLAAFGITGEAADALVNSLVGIPGEYTALIEVDTENARLAIDALQSQYEGLTVEALVSVAAGFTAGEIQAMVDDVMGTNGIEASLGLDVDEQQALHEIAAITGIPYEALLRILLDTGALDDFLEGPKGPKYPIPVPMELIGVPAAKVKLDDFQKEPRVANVQTLADTGPADKSINATASKDWRALVTASGDSSRAAATISSTSSANYKAWIVAHGDSSRAAGTIQSTSNVGYKAWITAHGDSSRAAATIQSTSNVGYKAWIVAEGDSSRAAGTISSTAYASYKAWIVASGDSSRAAATISSTAYANYRAWIVASADTGGAEGALNNTARKRYATIEAVKSGDWSGAAYGGAFRFAGGGVLDSMRTYATGGALARQSERAPDGADLINWAEPGTGGELHIFVPLADDGRRDSAKRYARMAVEELAMSPADLGWGVTRYAGGGARTPIPAMRGYAAAGAAMWGAGSGRDGADSGIGNELRSLATEIRAIASRPLEATVISRLDGRDIARSTNRVNARDAAR